MATREQLYTALRNADKAGDTQAAKALAAEIKKLDAPATPKPEPSFLDKLWTATKQDAGAVLEGVGQAADMLTNPTLVEAAARMAGPAGDLVAPLARKVAEAGNRSGITGHAEASVGELIPEVKQMNPVIRTGLQFVGNAALPVPELRFAEAVPKSVLPKAAKTASAAVKMAEGKKFGMDLSLGDTGGMTPKVVERILDVQPGSASVMNAARQKLADQTVAAAAKTADTFGPATSFRGVGEAAQSGAKNWIARLGTVVGKAYDAVPIKPSVEVGTTNTQAALAGLADRTPSNPELGKLLADPKLDKYLAALKGTSEEVPTGLVDEAGKPITRTVAKGGKLSWQDLKSFRTDIGEQRGDYLFSDGIRKDQLGRLYGALTQDMEAAATAQGPTALAKFQRANNLYRDGQSRIDEALTKLLGNDGKNSPEAAAALIQRVAKDGKSSSDFKLLNEVRRSLKPSEWGEISNGMVRLLGQPANSAGREFNPQTFVRAYADMAPEAKNLLFGTGELRQNLDQFAKVVGYVAKSGGTRNVSNTGMAVSGLAGLSAGGIWGLMAQAGTSFGVAKAWTNPAFVKWMTGYARAAQSGNEAAVKASVDRLSKLVAQNASVKETVELLQSYANNNVKDALTQSPSRAAAQDEPNGGPPPPN